MHSNMTVKLLKLFNKKSITMHSNMTVKLLKFRICYFSNLTRLGVKRRVCTVFEFEQVDFTALLTEHQEFNGRKTRSLNIRWDEWLEISLTIQGINCCTNHEAVRLHKLLQTLFSEIKMKDWYDVEK